MEAVIAASIGILAASGVWLILRPRTFQVIVGLSLLSYAVNLFIFSMGRLRSNAAPILDGSTALFLVVLLAARGLTGTDHVDGQER